MITPSWLTHTFPGLANVLLIGEGGQKWVFGANHASEGDVVLKLIKPSMDMDRVQREILAVRQVNSARVPKILDTGIVQGNSLGDLFWIREQRITGESLRDILQRGPLGKDEVSHLALHILEALSDVRRARIVHRDIKPENIMRDQNGSFWLLDFGIARHLDLMSLTATAALGGPCTIGYAPPEQYRNFKRDIDERADLFALAVTLVECLTGKNPYRDGARDVMEVVRRIEVSPLAIPAMGWDLDNKFSDFLAAMGQRRAECRPQTIIEALEWARELHRIYG